jgi:hypothetical protein
MELLRWRKANGGGDTTSAKSNPQTCLSVPKVAAVASSGNNDMPPGVSKTPPEGLSKMELLRWRKANGGGDTTSAKASSQTRAVASSGDMPTGLSKMERLKWKKLHSQTPN